MGLVADGNMRKVASFAHRRLSRRITYRPRVKSLPATRFSEVLKQSWSVACLLTYISYCDVTGRRAVRISTEQLPSFAQRTSVVFPSHHCVAFLTD